MHSNKKDNEKSYFINQVFFIISDISNDLLHISEEQKIETYTDFYTLHILFEQQAIVQYNLKYPPTRFNFEDVAELIINDKFEADELSELKIYIDDVIIQLKAEEGFGENSELTYRQIEDIFSQLFDNIKKSIIT